MRIAGFRFGRRQLAALARAMGLGYVRRRWARVRRDRAAAEQAERLRQDQARVDELGRTARARAQAEWERQPDVREPTPDTFVLYRVIGNDLPPRHLAQVFNGRTGIRPLWILGTTAYLPSR